MSCTFRGGNSSHGWDAPHDHARELLSDRMTEPLGVDQAAWLETHLAGCADCRAVDEAYREERDLLRAMRVAPPPRDLWARTTAALDAEEARSAGRRIGRAPRRTTSRRRRDARTPLFGFPRGGWAPVGALGSIAAVLVVGFLLGTMILGGSGVPAGTPGIAVAPSATPNVLPTPITVPPADVAWVSTDADGSIVVRQAPVGDVCPSNAPAGCAPIDTNANDVVTLAIKPKSVHQSPTSGQMIVIGQEPGQTALSMYIVNYPKATPLPTPSTRPTSTAHSTASPASTAIASPPASPATPSTSPTASAPSASPPVSSATPRPSPTASIIPNVTPPPSAAAMIALASDLDVLDAQTAAYSPDGTWFAFTARAPDLASGSDIYLWHAGDAAAGPVTTDHRSVFAGWAGDRLAGSRADVPVADAGSTSGSASPAAATADASPSPAAATASTPDGSPAPVGAPAEYTTSSFLIDPSTLARTAIPTAAWRPAIDPTDRFVVYWSGTVALDPVTGTWRTANGRLVIAGWPLVEAPAPATAEPSVGPSASAETPAQPSGAPSPSSTPAATPKATRSVRPGTPSASPTSSTGPDLASAPADAASAPDGPASPAPPSPTSTAGVPIGLPDDIGSAAGVDWAVAWDESGTHLAVWIGDHGDPSFGHLDLLLIGADRTGPAVGGEPLRAQPALPGVSLAEGHLVWATPPGVNGNGSQLQVYAYSGSGGGVTSGQGQTGADTVIVVQH